MENNKILPEGAINYKKQPTSTVLESFWRSTTTGELALTEDGVRKLLAVVTDLNHLGLLQLAIATGMRREDIVNVLAKDVDFDRSAVTFYEHKKRHNHTAYISQTVANTLKMMININKGAAYLFPSNWGSKDHISSRTAYNILQEYLTKASLPQTPFHALRATCVKLCQKRGWTIEETAKHIDDSIAVTQKHYSTPSDPEMAEVMRNKPLL